MTPEQALQIVAQAAQAASLPYQAHMQVQEALKALFEALKEKENG
jgi:hypothetical protein